MDDGRIGHAELRIGDAVLMLAGEFPEEDHRSPLTLGGGSVAIQVYVPDSAATYALAVERGATPLRPIGEHYGARGGVLRDPFGHRWFVQTQLEADDVPVEDTPGRRLGDIGYVTLRVPDGAGSTVRCSTGSWTAATTRVRTTSRRSPRPPACTAASTRRRYVSSSGSTTSPRLRSAYATLAARSCPSRTTTRAATPNVAMIRVCASICSAPAPATDRPEPLREPDPLAFSEPRLPHAPGAVSEVVGLMQLPDRAEQPLIVEVAG